MDQITTRHSPWRKIRQNERTSSQRIVCEPTDARRRMISQKTPEGMIKICVVVLSQEKKGYSHCIPVW